MSIKESYGKLLIEEYIKEQLKAGNVVSAIDLFNEAEKINGAKDLTQPLFSPEERKVEKSEEASASKINNTFDEIKQDLNVSYKELLSLSENSLTMYDRWKSEFEELEKQLIDIENEIENLLFLAKDTEGYHSIIVDNFTDLKSLDMTSTTAKVDIETSSISLKDNNSSSTRLFLENTVEEKDITFRVRSNIIFRVDLGGTSLTNIFLPQNNIWHTQIRTEKIKPVVCELIIKLGEEAVSFNRISLLLHDAGHSSAMNVTVLYSLDDVTYNKLPCDEYSQEISKGGNFYSSLISAKYVKFILSKSTPDRSEADKFNYQFGFRNISFYGESFSVGYSNRQKFESNWLFVEKENKDILEFEKAVLETCETLPSNSNITYSIAATRADPNSNPTPNWHKITPTNRMDENSFNPEINIFEIGKTSNQEIKNIKRYDSSTGLAMYSYVDASGILTDGGVLTGESELYSYSNPDDDVILDCLFYNEANSAENKYEVDFNESSILLFRGVDDWELKDLRYKCVVEVLSENGSTVEINNSEIFIDDMRYSGEIKIPKGIHRIEVKEEDFEGLQSKIEASVDFFAAIQMEKVSVFDILNNVKSTNCNKFALDLSLPGKGSGDTTAKKALLVKKELPTYKNVTTASEEKFKIKFNLIDELMKYIKVKGELETEDSGVTPSCDAYQVTLG